MARARTYLLTSTLEPSVDWVLWLDADIGEFAPTLFEDLLVYGNAGVLPPPKPQNGGNPYHSMAYRSGYVSSSATSQNSNLDGRPRRRSSEDATSLWNDVIVPNAMKRRADGSLFGFDMNNWAETAESVKLKAGLKEDELLIEGNIFQHMHRVHMAEQFVDYLEAARALPQSPSAPRDSSSSSSSSTRTKASRSSTASHQYRYPTEHPMVFSSADPKDPRDQRHNVSSPAYIGRTMELDGIGGVAALVRAEVHRMGATFPAFVVDHQLETEGFGVLAKKLGARIVGLPNLFVLHCRSRFPSGSEEGQAGYEPAQCCMLTISALYIRFSAPSSSLTSSWKARFESSQANWTCVSDLASYRQELCSTQSGLYSRCLSYHAH